MRFGNPSPEQAIDKINEALIKAEIFGEPIENVLKVVKFYTGYYEKDDAESIEDLEKIYKKLPELYKRAKRTDEVDEIKLNDWLWERYCDKCDHRMSDKCNTLHIKVNFCKDIQNSVRKPIRAET